MFISFNPLNSSLVLIILYCKSVDWCLYEGNTGISWVKTIYQMHNIYCIQLHILVCRLNFHCVLIAVSYSENLHYIYYNATYFINTSPCNMKKHKKEKKVSLMNVFCCFENHFKFLKIKKQNLNASYSCKGFFLVGRFKQAQS